jgi:Uma2 family endonuclease
MSAITTAPEPVVAETPAAIPSERLYRMSVDQYHEMAKHGILKPSDKVVLIRGYLVEQMTKNPPHIIAAVLTRVALEKILPNGWFLNVQDPVALADSEPEPDFSVIRGEPRLFLTHVPTASDAGMLVEISDTSLNVDRTTQLQLFAEASIPVYWIVNLVDRQVEVYTDPSGPAPKPAYARQQLFKENDSVPVVLDGAEVGRLAVRELLP